VKKLDDPAKGDVILVMVEPSVLDVLNRCMGGQQYGPGGAAGPSGGQVTFAVQANTIMYV
jgi:hypothetical protein